MSFHGFRGHRAGKPIKTGGYSQASERHSVHCFDQFGREYYFPAENQTGMPCGPVEPLFPAPFHPDPEYFIVNPDNTTELYVDYDSYIRNRISAMKEYHRLAAETAHKKGWEIPKLGEYSDDIIAARGKPPRAYQLGIAARQENPWVLGFSDTPDPRLVEYIENPTREIDEELDHYDFSERSYQSAVQQNQRGPATVTRPTAKPKPMRISTLSQLPKIVPRDLTSIDESNLPVGEGVAEEDEFDEETESAFGDMGDDADEGEIESLPDEAEGAEAQRGDDPALDALLDIEEEMDSAAAPSRVKPQNTDKAARQGARRPSQTSVPKKRAQERGAGKTEEEAPRRQVREFKREGRKSLADGARPVISD